MKIIVNLVLFCFFFIPLSADEIIQDKNGDFFLMKDDGTFKKLPRPKPGHKYVIKKTKKYLEDKKIQTTLLLPDKKQSKCPLII